MDETAGTLQRALFCIVLVSPSRRAAAGADDCRNHPQPARRGNSRTPSLFYCRPGDYRLHDRPQPDAIHFRRSAGELGAGAVDSLFYTRYQRAGGMAAGALQRPARRHRGVGELAGRRLGDGDYGPGVRRRCPAGRADAVSAGAVCCRRRGAGGARRARR